MRLRVCRAACSLGCILPERFGRGDALPAGDFGAATNLTSAEECSICRAGHYCVGGSEISCGRSTFNPLVGQSTQAACTTCPKNAVTNGTAATSAADCVCIAGYYNDRTSADESVECLLCPAGSKCVEEGTTLASLPLITGWLTGCSNL